MNSLPENNYLATTMHDMLSWNAVVECSKITEAPPQCTAGCLPCTTGCQQDAGPEGRADLLLHGRALAAGSTVRGRTFSYLCRQLSVHSSRRMMPLRCTETRLQNVAQCVFAVCECRYTLARSKTPGLSQGGAYIKPSHSFDAHCMAFTAQLTQRSDAGADGGGVSADAARAGLAFLTHNGTWLGMIAAGE